MELTKQFNDEYPDGVFTAHRCTVDYSRGNALNPDVLKGERIGKMFYPFGQTEGEMLEFLGTIVSYKPKKKWWHVVFDDGEEEDCNFRQLRALSTPPGFSLLQPVPPPVEAATFLNCTDGQPSGAVAAPSDLNALEDFRLEDTEYTFISVFFLTTTEPFVGAYILDEDFYHGLRMLSYDELKETAGVHVTPMPQLHKWIEDSKSMAVGRVEGSSSSTSRRTRNGNANAKTSDEGKDLLGKMFVNEGVACEVTGYGIDKGVDILFYTMGESTENSSVTEIRKWVADHDARNHEPEL